MNFNRLIYQSFSWRLAYYATIFLLNIVIARYFQATLSGWFNYTINLYSLAILFASLSLEAAIGYHLSQGNIEIKDISSFTLCWALLSCVAGIIFGYLFNTAQSVNKLEIIVAGALYVSGSLLGIFLQAIYNAKHDFRFPSLFGIVFNICLAFVLFIARIISKPFDLNTFFLVYTGAAFLQGILLYFSLLRRFKVKLFSTIRFPAIKLLFRYAFLVFTGNLVFFLVYRIDYWFVNRYCSAGQLGNYIQVSKLVQLFLIIPASLASVIFPVVAGGKVDLAGNIMQLSRVLITCFSVLLFFIVVSGNWVFTWLFGNSFDSMYLCFLFIIPGIFSLIIISLLGAYFAGKNLAKINLVGAIISLACMIALDLLLIPVYHINGASVACSISYIVYMLYMLYWFNKKEKIRMKDMFIVKPGDWRMFRSFLKTH